MIINIINLSNITNITSIMIITINIMMNTHLSSDMIFHRIPILNIAPMFLEILSTSPRSILFSISHLRKKVPNFLRSTTEDWNTSRNLQERFHMSKFMFRLTFQVFLILLRIGSQDRTFASKSSFMATYDFF